MGGAVAGAPPPPTTVGSDYNGLYRSPIDFWLTSMNLSAIGPPWSQLTAYDLNTGEIKWQVPNGTVAGLPEIPEWKGPTGAHWPRGGPLVTGGGLGVGPGGEPEVIWRPVRRYRRSAAWTAEPSWRVARGHGVVQRQACGVVLCACTDGLTQLDAAR